MTDEFDSILNTDGVDDAALLEDIKQIILDAEANKPRSLQRTPGCSEVGHPCQRKLAYLINASRRDNTEFRGLNRFSDPMPAIFGTAMHTWLEDAVRVANERLGRIRWIPEQKVEVRPGLPGTCDLYDLDTHSVLDYKVLGKTSYDKVVKYGVSPTYRAQRHLYGRGYKNLGMPVRYVGNVILSRTGTLRQMFLDREPYDDEYVDEVLNRIDDTEAFMADNNVEEDPRGFLRIPITPGDDCQYCGWWSLNPTGYFQCGGKAEVRNAA